VLLRQECRFHVEVVDEREVVGGDHDRFSGLVQVEEQLDQEGLGPRIETVREGEPVFLDALLRRTGDALRSAARTVDVVAQVGEDEFAQAFAG
jgi:hypothetical protein